MILHALLTKLITVDVYSVTVGDIVQVIKNGVSYNALEINVTVSQDTACKIYESCSKVPEAATISSNSQGFLQFQADSSLERGLVKMRLDFMDKAPEGKQLLGFDAISCSYQPDNNTIWNFNDITKCQCKVCTESCDSNTMKIVLPTFWHGFQWKLVLATYGVLTILIILLHIASVLRSNCHRSKLQKESVKEELHYIQPNKDD